MKTMKATMLAVLFLTSSVGFAQVFGDFDSNMDNSIDRDEFNSVYSNNFSNWDANADGNLEDREFYETTFNRLDTDMDGYLGQTEWGDGYDNVFGDYLGTRDLGQFDVDGDNMISSDEYYNGFADSDFYRSYDANSDSSIDPDEFNETVFNSWDENGDGILDNTEFDMYSSRYID